MKRLTEEEEDEQEEEENTTTLGKRKRFEIEPKRAWECECGSVNTRSKTKKWTELMERAKTMNKWRCVKNLKKEAFYNGEVKVQNECPKNKYWQMLHAITAHAVQGNKAKRVLFDPTFCFGGKQMIYVAISRCEYLRDFYMYLPYSDWKPTDTEMMYGRMPSKEHEACCRHIFNAIKTNTFDEKLQWLKTVVDKYNLDDEQCLPALEVGCEDLSRLDTEGHMWRRLDVAICSKGRPVLGIEVVKTHDVETSAGNKHDDLMAALPLGYVEVDCDGNVINNCLK